MRELIVDLFAGGGGASTAILNATGRHPDIAVNHNPDAIGVHQANHPQTRHYTCDVREVDPVEACTVDGVLRTVGLMWASPDCTHFSKARGGKPVEKGIRSLADVVVVWARAVRPRLIHLENVEEFQDWGPVLENGQPCPDRKGLDFRRWVRDLEDLGYVVDWRELIAADYGAPTTRKRLFLIARCDGEPIRWPEPSHASRATLAKGDLFSRGLKPWRAAAEIIDWSIPVPSIFNRKRPLKPKTQARIAKGLKRYVIDSPAPFIVPVTHTRDAARGPRPGTEPLQTITRAKGGELAVAAPTILPVTHAGSDERVYDPTDALRTVTAANRGEMGLASAMLVPRYGEREGQEPRVRNIADAYPAVVPTGNGGDLAATFLQKMNQNGIGTPLRDPLVTAMAQAPRHYEVAAYLEQTNTRDIGSDAAQPARTATEKAHQGVVAAHLHRQFGSTVSGRDLAEPAPTAMGGRSAGGKTGVVAAAIDKYYGSGVPANVAEPLNTATDKARFGLAGAFLEQANTGVVGHSATAPISTILAAGCHQRLIEVGMIPANDDGGSARARVIDFLWQHFGEPTEGEWEYPTGTPGARLKFGLVIIAGAVWQIVDVGMRMLSPRELFNAQGFPPTYIIEVTATGMPVTKTAQTSMAGNSVSPPPAEASLRANLTWMLLPDQVAA